MRQTIEFEDLYRLREDLLYSFNFPIFKKIFFEMKEKNGGQAAMGRVIIRFFRRDITVSILLIILAGLFEVAIPIFIKFMIAWLSDPNAEVYIGAIYAGIISLCALCKSNLARKSYYISSLMQLRVGIVMRGIIFEKVSKLSREGASNLDIGNLSNVMNHDTIKLQTIFRLLAFSISVPVIMISGLIYFLIYFNWLAVLFPIFMSIWIIFILIGNYYWHQEHQVRVLGRHLHEQTQLLQIDGKRESLRIFFHQSFPQHLDRNLPSFVPGFFPFYLLEVLRRHRTWQCLLAHFFK